MSDKNADGGPIWLAIVGNSGSNLGMARILTVIICFILIAGTFFAVIN